MSTRTVFITGAAAGIGRATALRFAADGFHVGAYDVDAVGLQSLAHEIAATGATVRTGLLDVTVPSQWESALDEFHGDHARLDVLINNAGILSSGDFAEIPLAAQHKIVDVNVNGVITGLFTASKYLAEGSVAVNLCSASAIYGQPELATYGASKAAVRSLTEALDQEWAGRGIRVIAIWPSFVRSAMTDTMNIPSIRRLGIRLGPDDVADGIWRAVHDRPLLGRVHYEIGLHAKALAPAVKFSPNWLVRRVNRALGT